METNIKESTRAAFQYGSQELPVAVEYVRCVLSELKCALCVKCTPDSEDLILKNNVKYLITFLLQIAMIVFCRIKYICRICWIKYVFTSPVSLYFLDVDTRKFKITMWLIMSFYWTALSVMQFPSLPGPQYGANTFISTHTPYPSEVFLQKKVMAERRRSQHIQKSMMWKILERDHGQRK